MVFFIAFRLFRPYISLHLLDKYFNLKQIENQFLLSLFNVLHALTIKAMS